MLQSVVLLLIAALQSGNIAVLIAARTTFVACAPDYLVHYLSGMLATLTATTLAVFWLAGKGCYDALPDPVSPPASPRHTTKSALLFPSRPVQRSTGWRWPWNGRSATLPLKLPEDITLECTPAPARSAMEQHL
jgi:hypothetical protein